MGIAFGHLAYDATARAAETPVAPAPAAAPAPELDELEQLVGPIALYPDELLAIALPASTYPLEIVQAARFLEKYEDDPELQPDEAWDPSILGLLNYPEVIHLMNEDLNWTWQLGEAVANQQEDVMDAVQSFRAKVDDVGNLESNEQVTVVRETEGEQQIIVIESASPEVIYVPQYQPSTVVVYQPAPVVVYSQPYPYYYRPAAVFWTGIFVGAAIGWGLSWGRGYHRSSIKVNRNVNVNVNRPTRPSTPNRPGSGGNRPGGGENWKPNPDRGKQGGRPGSEKAKRPSTGGGSRPTAGTGARPGGGPGSRPGAGSGARPGGGSSRPSAGTSRPAAGSGSRPSAGSGARPGGGSSRPSAGTSRPAAGSGSRPSVSSGRDLTSPSGGQRVSRGSSMGSYGSGSKARSSGSRGAASRGGRGGGGRGGRR
jgi:hypothetical protein